MRATPIRGLRAAQRVVEEVEQQASGCLGLDSPVDLDPVVEAAIAQHVVERAGGAGLLVPRAEHDGGDACREDRARAHDARLERDDERAVGESPVAGGLGRGAQREHLGVRGGVARELALVASRGDDSARAIDDDRADRHVARGGRLHRLGEREAHPLTVHRKLHAPLPSRDTRKLDSSLCESTLPITRSSPTS